MRAVVIIGVVVLATLHLSNSVKNDKAQDLTERTQQSSRDLRHDHQDFGLLFFCNGISGWLNTTGAVVIAGVSANVTAWTDQQVFVNFLNSLCNSTKLNGSPLNIFLNTTGSVIMQGASTNATLLTSAQLLISMFEAACNVTRGAFSVLG
nr:uncharacterized protein LOC128702970 isoform X3 [Cherax quadricarinatus]